VNVFINISFRKQRELYHSIYKVVSGFDAIALEVINGIVCTTDDSKALAYLCTYLQTNNIDYVTTQDDVEEYKMEFLFFFKLTQKGYAIIREDKNYVKKYIVFPVTGQFKSIAFTDFYLHFPENLYEIKHLSFQFDIVFKGINFKQREEMKKYLEKRIEESLRQKQLIT